MSFKGALELFEPFEVQKYATAHDRGHGPLQVPSLVTVGSLMWFCVFRWPGQD